MCYIKFKENNVDWSKRKKMLDKVIESIGVNTIMIVLSI